MTLPYELVLVRHAESVGNVMSLDERPKHDIATHAYDLTERGRRQAEKARDWLDARPRVPEVLYCSYYKRAIDTMDIIRPGKHRIIDPRLAEAQRGIYHSLTRDEIQHLYPGELIRKEREGLYHYRPWGGENWPDVELRIHSFLGTMMHMHGGYRVVIVTHGHWLILLRRILDGTSIDEAVEQYHRGPVENASITVYHSKRARLHDGYELQFSSYVVPWHEGS